MKLRGGENMKLRNLLDKRVIITTVHGNQHEGVVIQETRGCIKISQGEGYKRVIPSPRIKTIRILEEKK